jgi:hypothetical protein
MFFVGELTGRGRGGVMPRKRWSELSDGTRRLILWGAAFEGVLKALALIDLKRRPASQIRGSKAKWATAVVLINSVGAVPLIYFFRGRRSAQPGQGGPQVG